MKTFFRSALSLCTAIVQACVGWVNVKLYGPEIYREGWDRPDSDGIR